MNDGSPERDGGGASVSRRLRGLFLGTSCGGLVAVGGFAAAPIGEPMTPERLESEIRAIASDVSVSANAIGLRHADVEILCVFDPAHDRMRLVSPIAPIDGLAPEQLANAMAANFHTALDGRYASSDAVLYAAFIHPLSSLTPDELRSGVRQVANLVVSFGTLYSSGELQFGPGPEDPVRSEESVPEVPL